MANTGSGAAVARGQVGLWHNGGGAGWRRPSHSLAVGAPGAAAWATGAPRVIGVE